MKSVTSRGLPQNSSLKPEKWLQFILEQPMSAARCVAACAATNLNLAGDCIFPREGIFGWVVEPGAVHTGDEVRVHKLGNGTVNRALSDKPQPPAK